MSLPPGFLKMVTNDESRNYGEAVSTNIATYKGDQTDLRTSLVIKKFSRLPELNVGRTTILSIV